MKYLTDHHQQTLCRTAPSKYQPANQDRNHRNHQVLEFWQGGRPRWHSCRSTQGRPNSRSRDATSPAEENLGKEQVSADWKLGYLVKLPKEGELTQCRNWREITLLSIPSKVLTKIILERLKTALDRRLRQEQAGFRRGKSCTDQIATLRIIIEQSIEWQSPLYITFVDFEKAFDSVDRETIWKLMQHYGFPPKFMDIIRQLYENSTCRVIHKGKLTDPFAVRTGVRQGCLRKWGWIGHTLRKPAHNITRQALGWNPQGRRKVGRPRQKWTRSVHREAETAGMTWSQLERDAQDRVRWRDVVAALCSTGGV
ncbi:hypothetical protein C0Q70_12461 [Pomacea canaliculata]|uniref:Reverse transcriptase domain-containing protein n=1 Tax=Pomacea canaliculata TaxID=400727 RepID=A0A2T7P1M4_POMCA|nr:hypothetical protein C0Q70_12461 [Pomacea canaliculata]